MNRKLSFLALTLAAGLTACGGGTTVGTGEATYSARTTPPPTTTKPTTTKPTTAPPTTKKPTTAPPANARTHKVAALDNYVWDTYDLQATAGDKILFENKAHDSEHSFTVLNTDVDSGNVAGPDGKWTYVVDLAPGTYDFKCKVVTYMVGGKLTIY